MKAKARRSAPPTVAARWSTKIGKLSEEDFLPDPEDDDFDDLPPPEDEPLDDFEDMGLDELSLPSMGSEDDDLYCDDIDDEPDIDDDYGEYLDELSDPEDYLPAYSDDEEEEDDFFGPVDEEEDDLPPPDDDEDDLPPPDDDDVPVVGGARTKLPFRRRGVKFSDIPDEDPEDLPVDPKSFMLPENITLPVILPSQRAEFEARKLRASGQFAAVGGGAESASPSKQTTYTDSTASAASAASSATSVAPVAQRPARRGSVLKIDNVKAAVAVAVDASGHGQRLPLEQHAVFSKYFKMLKVGVPKELVALKMTQDGFDGKIIQLDPAQPLPAEYAEAMEKRVAENATTAAKVPVGEHPVYAKYFKMLKLGVPRSGVEQKLVAEGLDASIISLDPATLVPLKERRVSQMSAAVDQTLKQVLATSTTTQPKRRKKKLFVEGIGAEQLSSEKEFDKLFVEEHSGSGQVPRVRVTGGGGGSGGASGGPAQASTPAKAASAITVASSRLVQLISHKRSQNVSIVLARIKLTNEDMLDSIRRLSAELFASADQLRALFEALPLPEEVALLQQYTGPVEQLAAPERYMKTMLQLPDVKQRIAILIYKQQFLARWHEIKHRLGVLESACDQIKASKKLQKVLRTILKVVNKLHEDEDASATATAATAAPTATTSSRGTGTDSRRHRGITVESLVQLTTAKAFDRKTTVLQYVVTLIHRHDRDVLAYPADLSYLQEVATKLSPEIVEADLTALATELQGHIDVLRTLHEEVYRGHDEDVQRTWSDFHDKLAPLVHDLQRRAEVLRGKFHNILVFFGETRPQYPWADFMGALWTFTAEFAKAVAQVEPSRRRSLRLPATRRGPS
eukprot:gene385-247_t